MPNGGVNFYADSQGVCFILKDNEILLLTEKHWTLFALIITLDDDLK